MRISGTIWAFLYAIVFLCTPVFVHAQEVFETTDPVPEAVDIVSEPLAEPTTSEAEVDANTKLPTTTTSETIDDIPNVLDIPATELVDSEVTNEPPVVDVRIDETKEAIDEQIEIRDALITAVKEELVEVETNLPFTLVSTTTFSVNEIPEFVFSLEEEDGFIEETINTVSDTVVALYQESFVEVVVDAIVEAVQDVIDFVVPEVQGQTLTPQKTEVVETVSTQPTPVEEVLIEQPPQVQEEQVTESEVLGEIVSEVGEIDVTTSSTATSTATSTGALIVPPALPYAVVDGVFIPTEITRTETSLRVRLEGIFSVGEHAVFIHMLHEDTEVIVPLVFAVEGTVLFSLPLYDTYAVEVIQDYAGYKTLWLTNYASGTVQSFEKITEGEYLGDGTLYVFEERTLFWSVPSLGILMGYDVVSKSMFSQTMNTTSSQKDILKLDRGDFEIVVEGGIVDLQEIKQKSKP
jgi:hypothetical protein